MKRRIVTLVIAALAAAPLSACGDDGPDDSTGPDTPTFAEMVGTWTGTVRSEAAGNDDITMVLKADSTMTMQGETNAYPLVTGRWALEDGQYVSTGSTGTVQVTQTARANRGAMNGSWSVSNGVTGSFSVLKQ